MVFASSTSDISNVGKSALKVHNPEVSSHVSEPRDLYRVPTHIPEPALIIVEQISEEFVKPHDAESSFISQVSLPTSTDMVVLEPNPITDVNSELVHQQIKQFLLDRAVDKNKSWGSSDKWVLEHGDWKKEVVPMEIKRKRIFFPFNFIIRRILLVDKLQKKVEN